MPRLELLDDDQAELVREILRELVDRKGGQIAAAEAIGVAQQTISKALNADSKVGISVATRLSQAGYCDIGAVLSRPPARWNAELATMERALVRLALEKPYAASAYASAVLVLRDKGAESWGTDPRLMTVEDASNLIREMVGEKSLDEHLRPKSAANTNKKGEEE